MMTKLEYERVVALRSQGLAITEIARQLGYHPATITKWIRAGGPPDGRSRSESDRVIDSRWSARVSALLAVDRQMTGTKVYAALTAEGFPGSYVSVIRHLRAIRGPRPRAITPRPAAEGNDPARRPPR
jgi:transposase